MMRVVKYLDESQDYRALCIYHMLANDVSCPAFRTRFADG